MVPDDPRVRRTGAREGSESRRWRFLERETVPLWVLLPLLVPLGAALVLPERDVTRSDGEVVATPRADEPPPAAEAPPAPTPTARPVGTANARTPDAPDVAGETAPPAAVVEDAGPDPDDAARLVVLVSASGSGRPLSGASVELGHTPLGSDVERVRVVRTDPDGRASARLGPGVLRVVGWREGSAGGPDWLELRAGETLEHELALRLAHPVAGVVLDAETELPVAGATVAFWTFAERDAVRTGPDGTFLHRRFPTSEFAEQVRVEAPGYGAAVAYLRVEPGGWEQPATLAGGEARGGTGTPWLEVVLVRALEIRGSVVDAGGAPVAGADVSAEGYFRVLPDVASRDGAAGVTDEHGAFVLGGLRSDIGHSVLVRASGYAALELEVPAGEALVELGLLALERERSLTGVVVDAEGHPVEDALVLLSSPDARDDRAEPEDAGVDVSARLQGRELETRTAADGTFVFEHLLERPYRLNVSRGFETLLADDLEVEPSERVAHVEVALPADVPIVRGRVEGAGDLAERSALHVEVHRGGRVSRVHVDEHGRFRVAGLAAGTEHRFVVSARSSRGAPLRAEATVWASESPVLRLTPVEGVADAVALAANGGR